MKNKVSVFCTFTLRLPLLTRSNEHERVKSSLLFVKLYRNLDEVIRLSVK